MATAVGKKFPNLSVDAMNEMGDTFKLNVLEEAINNKKLGLEEQNRILSDKIDAMIGLLSNINSSNSNIDDHLTSQIDKNKEMTI